MEDSLLKKLFLLDMDGTIYIDNQLFASTLDLLSYIKEKGSKYLFITNNSSKSVFDYTTKLNRLGIPTTVDDFYTSTMATIQYLKSHHKKQKVYVMGTRSFLEELIHAGINVTVTLDDDINVVLMGFDTELTSRKLYEMSYLLTTRDLPYIATNPDYVCPVAFGYIPDCGSVADMLYNATKKRPLFIGKPNPLMIELARKTVGAKKSETIIIGDRLYTDILAGVNAKVETVCVLSGETTKADLENSEIKPTHVYADIDAYFQALVHESE